ncbi:MAG: GNAT family N-acetyltransferase [Candidatus Cloacimonetes bacterium]|nr:GNAT family N-acetyltransferase [Candidatus Cloacimonadota bacterium]
MKLTLCGPELFDRQAGTILREREVEFSLMLGILKQIRSDPMLYPGNNLMATVREGKRLLVAALRTPPYKLLLYTSGAQPEALQLLAQHLARHDSTLPGVLATDDVAEAWSALWRRLTGASSRVGMYMRLHVLNEVSDVSDVPGQARWLTESDTPVLAGWVRAFHDEATPGSPPVDAEKLLARRMGNDTLLVWHDGAPVSMAALVRPSGNAVCLNLVYTPLPLRRRGYATALVAELSRQGLAHGYSRCTLFTDLANPISNSIYRKIGYKPVSDWKEIAFITDSNKESQC